MSEYLRLKELIEARHGKFPQGATEFARIHSYDRAKLIRHCSGHSEVKYGMLIAYAEALDVDVREIFQGTVPNCYLVYLDNPPQDNVLKPPKK